MASSISNTSPKVKFGIVGSPYPTSTSLVGVSNTTPMVGVQKAPKKTSTDYTSRVFNVPPQNTTTGGGAAVTGGYASPTPSVQQRLTDAQNQLSSIQGGVNNLRTQEQQSNIHGLLKPPAQQATQFGSLVGQLIGSSSPSNSQKGLIESLRKTAERNAEIGNNAQDIATKYSDEIARVGKLGAGAVAGGLSTGSNVVGSGNAAIASQSASQRMDALAAAEAAALQGTGQQLTGAEQQANAFNQALGGSNTQQQLQQAGLSSAATYAQPSTAGYGQTVFDPLTGTFQGQSSLDPSVVANQLAQEVQSGRMTYDQAVASLGYAGGAGQQFLNQALGGGYNIPLSTASIQGQASIMGQLPQLESYDVAAEGIKNKITSYLDQNTSLNASDLAAGNKLQQWIQGKQLTDPKYQTLFNYLNEYTNTLAPILGVGGDPTNLKTEIAQSFINAAASGQSIKEVLENMQQLSRGKLQDIRSGATGGGVVSNPGSSTTGSGGLFDW